MTKVNCFVEECNFCKDYVCTNTEITLNDEHSCYGGCDNGWDIPEEEDEDSN